MKKVFVTLLIVAVVFSSSIFPAVPVMADGGWIDDFNGGQQQTWIEYAYSGTNNSFTVDTDNRYELHTEASGGDGVIYSYVDDSYTNYMVTAKMTAINSDDEFSAYLVARGNSTSDTGYVVGLVKDDGVGSVNLVIGEKSGAGITELTSQYIGSVFSTGFCYLKMAVFSQYIYAKCWSGTLSDEPSTWTLTATDDEGTILTGFVGVMLATDSANYTTAQVAFDDIVVTSINNADGSYNVGAAPTLTLTAAPSAMDPMSEQTVTVNIATPDNDRYLTELTSVIIKVWYDADGGEPSQSEFDAATADTQNCAVFTWATAESNFTLDAGTGTTWVRTDDTIPTLDYSGSGDFTLKFKPGKVATETTDSARWQIAATATSEYGTGFCYSSYDDSGTYYGAAMNWYGEISFYDEVSVSWGTVPPQMDFDNALAQQSLGQDVTYISNGNYKKMTKSGSTWTGLQSNTASLNTSGTPGENEFSLKALNANDLENAVLLSSEYVDVDTTGNTITAESGSVDSDNYLWLKLGQPFVQDTFSGGLTYSIGSAQ